MDFRKEYTPMVTACCSHRLKLVKIWRCGRNTLLLVNKLSRGWHFNYDRPRWKFSNFLILVPPLTASDGTFLVKCPFSALELCKQDQPHQRSITQRAPDGQDRRLACLPFLLANNDLSLHSSPLLLSSSRSLHRTEVLIELLRNNLTSRPDLSSR